MIWPPAQIHATPNKQLDIALNSDRGKVTPNIFAGAMKYRSWLVGVFLGSECQKNSLFVCNPNQEVSIIVKAQILEIERTSAGHDEH